MHIYTMGTRSYAEAVVREIDPNGLLFQDRILSRDENGSMTKKRLERLFPSDTSKVVVLDDRGDVWDYSPNLIQIKPYEYFIGIGDINSPFAQPKKDIIPSPESLAKTIVHKQPSAPPTTPPNTNGSTDPSLGEEANDKAKENHKDETNDKAEENHKDETSDKAEENHKEEGNDKAESNNKEETNHKSEVNSKEDAATNSKEETEANKDQPKEISKKQNNDTTHPENGQKDNDIKGKGILTEKTQDEDIYSDTEEDEENAPKYPPPKDDTVFKVPERVQKDSHLPTTHDTDDILRVIRKSLFDVHNIYFNDLLKRNQKPDVAIILNSLKRKVLRGVNLVFSGIIPLHQTRPEDSWIWRMATSFGANCFHELTGKVTHLIAANVSLFFFYLTYVKTHGI